MLRSTWHFLKFAFHTAVVLFGAVVKAPPPLQRTFVKLFAFVQLRAALGVAGVHHHKVIGNFSILRENSQK